MANNRVEAEPQERGPGINLRLLIARLALATPLALTLACRPSASAEPMPTPDPDIARIEGILASSRALATAEAGRVILDPTNPLVREVTAPLAATPTPARPEPRTVPGAGGGIVEPSATPRPPELTATLVPTPTPMTTEAQRRLFDPESLPSESSSFPMPELMSRQQMPGEINKLIASVQAIDKPLDPDVGLGRLKSLKGQFEAHMKSAQALIAKGDIDGANLALLEAKRIVDALGYGPKEVKIPTDVKKKEDPLAKLLGANESVDPRIEIIYWSTVRLLRSTNKDYLIHPYYQGR